VYPSHLVAKKLGLDAFVFSGGKIEESVISFAPGACVSRLSEVPDGPTIARTNVTAA
jgi:hypothetical protein